MGNKRILFVDDESLVLQGLQRMLRGMRNEWDMVFAESGEAGLARLAEAPFDLVVSDMRMPGMNGAQFLTEVMRLYPHTVRLVLSGHADQELVALCVGVAHQFLNKPCEADHLKSTIQNALFLGSEVASSDVKKIIGSIDKLPCVPAIYQELTDALQKESTSSETLGQIIQKDIGMTAKMLKLVNSAFFGLRRSIDSPQDAVSFLGIETIKTLVLANKIFEDSPHFRFHFLNIDQLWVHSMHVAATAKAIAKSEHADRAVTDNAFVGGILHDVGILVLATNFQEAYERVTQVVVKERIPLPDAEHLEFGVTHAEVGSYLLGLWGIPTSILEIVNLHHRPQLANPKAFSALLAVHAADLLAGQHDHHPLFEVGDFHAASIAANGLTERLPIWRELADQPEP